MAQPRHDAIDCANCIEKFLIQAKRLTAAVDFYRAVGVCKLFDKINRPL